MGTDLGLPGQMGKVCRVKWSMSRRTRKGRRDEGQKHPSVLPSSYAPELGVLLGGRVTECELSARGLLLPPGWTGDPQGRWQQVCGGQA